MKILECAQMTDEWFAARIGSVGGSSIASVVAKGEGKMRKNLLYRLVGEILSDVKYEGHSNADMLRGIEQEPDARNMYEFVTGNKVKQDGLIKPKIVLMEDENKHYSPDGLVYHYGMIEIKSVIPSVHVETILSDKVPAAYRKQVQWGLHICERKWCDFVSYSPLITDRPIWIKRVHRDEKLIKELDGGADKFIEEMLLLVEKIKGG